MGTLCLCRKQRETRLDGVYRCSGRRTRPRIAQTILRMVQMVQRPATRMARECRRSSAGQHSQCTMWPCWKSALRTVQPASKSRPQDTLPAAPSLLDVQAKQFARHCRHWSMCKSSNVHTTAATYLATCLDRRRYYRSLITRLPRGLAAWSLVWSLLDMDKAKRMVLK